VPAVPRRRRPRGPVDLDRYRDAILTDPDRSRGSLSNGLRAQ
jgi:hypothetical protein